MKANATTKRPRRGRPPLSEGQEAIASSFRVPKSLLARLDAYAQTLQQLRPGSRVSRSDALRALLEEGLDRRGQPNFDTLEDRALQQHPRFAEILRRSLDAVRRGEGVPFEQAFQQLIRPEKHTGRKKLARARTPQ